MEDQFLIEQVLKGNKNAFKFLLVRYQRPIFSFLRKFYFSDERVEELAQEVFLKAYAHIQSFDISKGTFASWLFTIARNVALNEKKKKKEVNYEDDSVFEDFSILSPEKMLEVKMSGTLVRRLIDALPQPFKTAVLLSYIEELSLQEIAAIEECEVGTVKTRIFRGKNILRKMLFSEGQYV